MSEDDKVVWADNPKYILGNEKSQLVGPKGYEKSVLRKVYTYRDKKTGQECIFDYVDFSKLPKEYQPIGEDKEYRGKNNPESHTITQFKYLNRTNGHTETSATIVDECSDAVAFGNVKNRSCHIKYAGKTEDPRSAVEKTYSYIVDGDTEEKKYTVKDFVFNKQHRHVQASQVATLNRINSFKNELGYSNSESSYKSQLLVADTPQSRALKGAVDDAVQTPEVIEKSSDGSYLVYKRLCTKAEDNGFINWPKLIKEAHPENGQKIIDNINKDLVERMLEIANEQGIPVRYKENNSIPYSFTVNPGEELKVAQSNRKKAENDAFIQLYYGTKKSNLQSMP